MWFPLGKSTDKLGKNPHIFAKLCSKGPSSGIPALLAFPELKNPGALEKRMTDSCSTLIHAYNENGL